MALPIQKANPNLLPIYKVGGPSPPLTAVDRLAPLLEESVDRQNRLHRPARRRARAAGFVLALALVATLALFAQWRFAVIETPDPTDGWRGHLWERYGPELRDCVIRADRQGKAMLCQVFDPEPELP